MVAKQCGEGSCLHVEAAQLQRDVQERHVVRPHARVATAVPHTRSTSTSPCCAVRLEQRAAAVELRPAAKLVSNTAG